MRFHLDTAEVYVPDGLPVEQALARTTHLAISGGFIFSTGDQCGWNTPDANIFAMLEAAETYGR